MKKIFAGIRYDTARAEKIGEAVHLPKKKFDFSAWRASLYVTPRGGRYFLAGSGGPMTRFAPPAKNGLLFGEKIIPLSKKQAEIWAVEYLNKEIKT